ncbi:hypothetical protein [Selenomonas sp. KH1T6]|uniref:hypothetical protein n=1 Tax=Selenomonas sp. KH1T6 TaxID=3158784 RepID=UPI0008A74E55|nr:hypothetical protein SAMN05216583_10531 [Selenomonas ruminantium]
MDSFWSILVLVAIVVISDQLGGKKKKVPQRPLPQPGQRPGRQKLPMPWPDIKPPVPETQEPEIYAEPEPELPVLKQPVLRRAETAEREQEHRTEERLAPIQAKTSNLGLTPEHAISALAWSEILGKPKAYKNGPFRK